MRDWDIWKKFNSKETIASQISTFLKEEGINSIAYNSMQLSREAGENFYQDEILSFAKIIAIIEFGFCKSYDSLFGGLSRREVNTPIEIIECGSHHGFGFDRLMSGGVAYLFAKENLLKVPYWAYDPKITRELLSNIERNRLDRETSNETIYTRDIYERLREMTLDSYSELESKVREIKQKRRLPVIISKGVLSAPRFWLSEEEFIPTNPFWTLPGFHTHNVSLEELEKNRGVEETKKLREGEDTTNHLQSFCSVFDIHPESIGCYFDRNFLLSRGRTGEPFEATYFWLNE